MQYERHRTGGRFAAGSLRLICFTLCAAATLPAWSRPPVGRWWHPYQDGDVAGPRILGFWRFDGDGENLAKDASSHRHAGSVRGATWTKEGRYGGCLESRAGFPVSDTSHAIVVARSPLLSPARAFSVEMWIRPKDAEHFLESLQPVLIDSKYVPTEHTGMMWHLTRASGGMRQMAVELGLGDHSRTWYSRPIELVAGKWHHVAFTYDARGTVSFYRNGSLVGRSYHPDAGPLAAARRPLAIGDRLGSNYAGFPGWIDEVRIVEGLVDFRPLRIDFGRDRYVMTRGSRRTPPLSAHVVDQTGQGIDQIMLSWRLPGGARRQKGWTPLRNGTASFKLPVDPLLKPGTYEARVSVTVPKWPGVPGEHQLDASIGVVVKPRPLPHRLPVVMWGIGGVDEVVREIPRLKEIGFTHCLGIRVDYGKIWKTGKDWRPDPRGLGGPPLPGTGEEIVRTRRMLDAAQVADLKILASLSPGRWLRTAPQGKPFLRVDRKGQPYRRHDISGRFEPVQRFCYNTGYAVGWAYGNHPAFAGALVHSELRGESQV